MAKILFSIQHADDVLPQEDRHTPGIRKGWDSKSRDNFQRQRQQCQNGAVQHFHTAAAVDLAPASALEPVFVCVD